ncbi:GGDEF domain-containing protein [Sphingomonas profundi]|uniref:GGDEF domain-containing protein n=1 Tax=Alterirhizorhabdus profundi TaxID=2681549 RepID=UPI0018D15EE6|nr:GGDEF domain-containing protein [Sphingomonas profundi]
MHEGLSVLVALLLLSAMLAAILTIAWVTLERPRHARTWAIAFAIGTVQWTINLVHVLGGGSAWLFLLVNILSVVVSALLALGFRQRAGVEEHRLLFAGAGALIVAVLIGSIVIAPTGWLTRAAPLLFRGVVLAGAAAVVGRRGEQASAAERSMVAMLWLFALFSIAVAAVAIGSALDGGRFGHLDRWLLLLGLPAAYAGTGLFITFLLAADLAERMRALAARDPLTGILNRRGFEEAAGRVMANALRHAQPLSLAIADLDRFKAVNDAHGHAAGDALLRRFSDRIGEAIRQGDLFGRLGGEEFVLLLVNTPGEAAVAVIDRLRRDVATIDLPIDPPQTVTTSFGVAELAPGDASLDALLARADDALYRSKLDGRDRVTFAPVGR